MQIAAIPQMHAGTLLSLFSILYSLRIRQGYARQQRRSIFGRDNYRTCTLCYRAIHTWSSQNPAIHADGYSLADIGCGYVLPLLPVIESESDLQAVGITRRYALRVNLHLLLQQWSGFNKHQVQRFPRAKIYPLISIATGRQEGIVMRKQLIDLCRFFLRVAVAQWQYIAIRFLVRDFKADGPGRDNRICGDLPFHFIDLCGLSGSRTAAACENCGKSHDDCKEWHPDDFCFHRFLSVRLCAAWHLTAAKLHIPAHIS